MLKPIRKLCVFGPSVQCKSLLATKMCDHGLLPLFNGKLRTQKQFNVAKSYRLNIVNK